MSSQHNSSNRRFLLVPLIAQNRDKGSSVQLVFNSF